MRSRSRILELLLALVVVAAVVTLARREKSKPDPAALPTPTASAVPVSNKTPVWSVEDDYANAEGLTDCEEVSYLKIPQSTKQRIERGRQLTETNCASCHGSAPHRGDGEYAKGLDPAPQPLVNVDNYKYGHREKGLFRTILYGVDGTGMASFEGVLTDDQIWDITFYLRSIQKPARSR